MTTIGSLFTGYAGLELALDTLTPTRLAWVSDNNPTATRILEHHYPNVPNHGDITRIEWANVEPVDILTGGFPCQDISKNGNHAGMKHNTRSGLWAHMAAAIAALHPALVVIENVRELLSADAHSDMEPCPWCMGNPEHGQPILRTLGRVLGDLGNMGYHTQWAGVRASDVGAAHTRYRIFVTAHPATTHPPTTRLQRRTPNPHGSRQRIPRANGVEYWGEYADAIHRWEVVTGRAAPPPTTSRRLSPRFVEWHMGLPEGWVTDVPGLTRRTALQALGNGVVPQQAAAALRHLETMAQL